MAKIYGRFSGREFNPTQAGGLLRKLSIHDVKITNRGIDSVEQHVSRFGPDAANEYMIGYEILLLVKSQRYKLT